MNKPLSHLCSILDPAYFVASFGLVRPVEEMPIPDLPMRSSHLDVVHMQNEGIEEIAGSAVRAEESGELRRMVYSPCCPVMRDEAHQAGIHG